MTRRLTMAAVATLMGALVGWDLATSAPLNPFKAPPVLALGSGQASQGGHCAALPPSR
jgi:hypothetical protein